ncbi:phage terminase large subunit family protein [Candidatus Arsenophonus triatominarum]|uniref:phage terminase large subunit family protein n=1 Tax=Candidatus Arsenophonus triatominarum TaxID=57911 RepID=UPI000AFE2390|nr:phage terminase large subunit family protein [Candidatus Arsenophonus triatominarum]
MIPFYSLVPVFGISISEQPKIYFNHRNTLISLLSNTLIVLGSTPTVKHVSRIEKVYNESDQRHYWVPCPHCGEFQILEWGGPDTPYGIARRLNFDYSICIKNRSSIVHPVSIFLRLA